MVDKPQPAAGGRDRRRKAVAAITLAANLGSFLFLVLVARSAQPAIFGGLAALAGIALLFEVPANALQVAVGRRVSDARADGRAASIAAGPLLVDATAWGAGVCAVLLALSPLVEGFLHLPSVTSALLLGAYALPVGISVVRKVCSPAKAGSRCWPPGCWPAWPCAWWWVSSWSAITAASRARSWPWCGARW